jgi:ferredoxin
MTTYRIEIDHTACIGYAGCVKEAPQVFWLEDDLAYSRGKTDDPNVLEAAELCPVSAITVAPIEDAAQAA